jgi:hypothetical protein
MSAEPVSPSGRPLIAKDKSVVSNRSSSVGVSNADAYIAQIIMKDQQRQEKQEASEMRRLGVELREVRRPRRNGAELLISLNQLSCVAGLLYTADVAR